MSSGAMVPQTGLKGTGVLVLLAGPAGAGKSTLIASAGRAYSGMAGIVFPERVQTGGTGKIVSSDAFLSLQAAGALAAHWRGKNQSFGLPQTIFEDLANGQVVVASVSREVIGSLRRAHSRVHVVYVTANSEQRSQRLAADFDNQGPVDEDSRLDRPPPPISIIDNSGHLADAIEEFMAVLSAYVSLSRKPLQ